MKDHAEVDASISAEQAFDQFVTAVTCRSILTSFNQLLDVSGLRHVNHAHFYDQLKASLKGSWKAESLWTKLDKRAAHKDYKKGQACSNIKVLVIGSGPCGLRTAIECAFLGAKTVIIEKRDRFSRNNVLHLWPYLITDLRNLGAKKFFGKFCAGAIDHISIRQLQCILLKVALLLGVEVHMNVTFEGLVEPPLDQSSGVGWKCNVTPSGHILSEFEFDVLIGADGKRNTLSGFKRKEFRGKLALAITANFINRNTQAEARVEEISGVAYIFNQKFFTDLKESTRIDLENIVYYKDDTHYFVMTAKKASLLEKGVLIEDFAETLTLLDRSNVNQDALMAYAREAADFSTNYQLPTLDYAVNHYGQADVAMFDFTSMFAAENASKYILKNGHHLLIALVGDTLLEPFWPTGSGCARGFLSAFDAAWMIHNWAMGKTPLQVLAERESIFTVLSQTTPSYLLKNYNMYSIDPNTRYPNLNLTAVKPSHVKHLYEGGVVDTTELDLVGTAPIKKARNGFAGTTDSYNLLQWCQKVLNTGKYSGVHVVNFTSSWHSGLALCALIHSFRPEFIDYTQLLESHVAANNQLAFSIAERELGIPPVMSGEDMAKCLVPDKLTVVSYLTQFYDLFRHEPMTSPAPLEVNAKHTASTDVKQSKSAHTSNRRISFLQKLNSRLARSKKRKEQEENEGRALRLKKLKEVEEDEVELVHRNKLPAEEIASRHPLDRMKDIKMNRAGEMSGALSVTAMADILVAKFRSHESTPSPESGGKMKNQPSFLASSAASETCYFCQKKVYIMERMSAEGEFFHRGCLKCDHCGMGLRLTNYSCDKDVKPVKFYCYRHAIPEMRIRPLRKRMLEEKTVPDVVITPALKIDPDSVQASTEKSPRKSKSTHPTCLLASTAAAERTKNTPERVEFEISFDGAEESEEEQFEHNLRASLSSDTILDDDSDCGSSDSDVDSAMKDEVWKKEQHKLHKTDTSGQSDLKIDPSPAGFSDDLTENVLKNVRDNKSGQWMDRTDYSEKIVRNRHQHLILKNSLKGLQVSDIDDKMEGVAYVESMKKDKKTELLEKAAVSQAVKRLLKDSYSTCFPRNSTADNLLMESSDSGRAEVFVEGRLSPSASRTRRFRMKRHTRHSKEWQMSNSKISDDECLGDRPRHKMTSNQFQSQSAIVTNDKDKLAMYQSLGTAKSLRVGTQTDHDFLKNVACESNSSDTDDLVFSNIDDRFVTDRHIKLVNKFHSDDKENYLKGSTEDVPMDSSFSISTPSDSESSVSSVELDERASSYLGAENCDSSIKSGQDMMQEHNMTSSRFRGKQFMEELIMEKANVAVLNNGNLDNKEVDLKGEEEVLHNSSLFMTPGDRMDRLWNLSSRSILTPASLTRPLPPPGSQVHSPQTPTLLTSSTNVSKTWPAISKSSSGTFTLYYKPHEQDSSDSDIFLSPVERNFESQFVSKQPLCSSERVGVISTPRPTNPVLANDLVNRGRPLGSVLTKHAATNSQNIRPPRKILDLPKLNLLTKTQKHLSSTDQPIIHSPNKAIFDTLTDSNKKVLDDTINKTIAITSSSTASTTSNTGKSSASSNQTDSMFSEHRLTPAIEQSLKTNGLTNNSKQKLDLTSKKNNEIEVNKRTFTNGNIIKHTNISSLDENEAEEMFYTPCGPDKKVRPYFVDERESDQRYCTPCGPDKKRIPTLLAQSFEHFEATKPSLPTSPLFKESDLTVHSAQQIRDICKAGIEKAREQARDRAKLKTDEELGITVVSSAFASKVPVLSRQASERRGADVRHGSPYNTDAISNTVSDSNDNRVFLLETSTAKVKEDIQLSQPDSSMGLGIKESVTVGVTPSYSHSAQILERRPDLGIKESVTVGVTPSYSHSAQILERRPDLRIKEPVTSDVNPSYSHSAQILERRPDLGIKEPVTAGVNPSYSHSAQILARQPSLKTDIQAKHNANGDTNGMPADRFNSKVTSPQITTPTITECDQASEAIPSKGKKNKLKPSKTKKETKDKESEVKEKKGKSLLALIGLTKIPKKETKDKNIVLSPDSSPKEKSFILKTKSKNKTDKKKKGNKKGKLSKDKSALPDNLDAAPNSEYCKNLAICSVFHSKISNRQAKNLLAVSASNISLPQDYRADDEVSDSDESHISRSPMQKRRNDDLQTRVTQRLHRIQKQQQKQAEQKRLRMAQEIQRQLEEVEVRQRDLEDRGIAVEKALRGDAAEGEDDSQLMNEWFTLVHEKNALLRYESELMVRAKELELEDRQARLEMDFRERSKQPVEAKTENDLAAEDKLLEELLDVVEQRNSLVAMLEEDRLREQKEDSELKEMMEKKGYVLSPLSFDTCGKEGRNAQ